MAEFAAPGAVDTSGWPPVDPLVVEEASLVPQAASPTSATAPTGAATRRLHRRGGVVRMFDISAPIRPRTVAAALDHTLQPSPIGVLCADS
jgi:hypothetical protein